MSFSDEIIKILKPHVKAKIELEAPPNPDMGDFAFPCFEIAKQLKKKPNEVAQELAKKVKLSKTITKVEVMGPYLNFFLNKAKQSEVLFKQIQKEKEKYGAGNEGRGKTIAIDFSSPNIAKPFGIGHLRSTVIGNSLYKIFSFLGYKCVGVNHLGDWGTQFGKLIVAYKNWGKEKELQKNPINHLLSIYVKFHDEAEINEKLNDEAREWFSKLEQGDKEALQLWELFKELSLEEFNKHYKRMDIHFDSFAGEAFYIKMLDSTVEKIKKKIKTEISEGALVVNLEKYKIPPLMLRKSDGATTYATRDMAAALYRLKEYKADKLLYVVGADQKLHFTQLFNVLEMMGIKKEKLVHADFGMMKFAEGKMSTRKGNIIFLEEVLDRAVELARKIIKEKNPNLENKEEVAEIVGIGAVIFGDLSNDRVKDITFNWDKMLSFEGETAPYIQYTYARCCSLLRKSEKKLITQVEYSLLREKIEHQLINLLQNFPAAVQNSASHYKPSIIARYLLDLSLAFNSFYQSCPILQEKENLRNT
ncbi:arginine--tRNA ligase, partial [Candidatus Woesearchaeota archaeon]|nr:arginine--tRNA ligase [Candidatus Woesearchaeota archaeon]